MRYWPALAIAVALFAAGCTSSSSPTAASPTKPTFTADLKPANEVPPVTNAESNGSGNATITFDLTKDAAGNVTAASATFVVNLNGFPANKPINAAHIHEGAAGVGGAIIVTLYAGPTKGLAFTGELVGSQLKASQLTQLPAGYGADPKARLDSLIALMRSGGVYVNVHTRVNPGGAIRGQVQAQ